jgi:hypothetical protein
MTTTLFIPLGRDSIWQNNELRYALRSWGKFGNIERVIIVGEKPDWYTGEHYPLPTSRILCKTEDIFRKTQLAATLSESFIYANDDHILLEPLAILPYYYQGLISDFRGGSETFMRYVINTDRICPRGKYFDVHTPMVIQSDIILSLPYVQDTIMKSYYCYEAGVEGVEYKDCKINQHLRTEEIEKKLAGKWMFSFGDNGLSNDMRKYLMMKFPDKSKWEG